MIPLKEIFDSFFYKDASRKAEQTASDKNKALELIDQAMEKLENLGDSIKEQFTRYKDDLKVFFRMLRAYFKGDYKDIPWKTIVKTIGVLIYFLLIIDLIPDFIPFTGYLDDLTLFGWMLNSIEDDLKRFEQWEKQQLGNRELP